MLQTYFRNYYRFRFVQSTSGGDGFDGLGLELIKTIGFFNNKKNFSSIYENGDI